MKKELCTGLVVGLAVLSCTGCGKEKISAQDVMSKCYESMEKEDSFAFDMSISADITAKSDDESQSIPVKIKMSGKADEDTIHINLKGTSESDGEKEKETKEIYIVKDDDVTIYQNTNGDGWQCETYDSDTSEQVLDNASLLKDDSLFADAKCEKTKDGYKVTQNIGDMLNNKDVQEVLEDAETYIPEEYEKLLKDVSLVYEIDKDYMLKKVSTNCKLSAEVEDADVDVDLTLDFELSDYGKVEVSVPDSVVKEAEDSDEPEGTDTDAEPATETDGLPADTGEELPESGLTQDGTFLLQNYDGSDVGYFDAPSGYELSYTYGNVSYEFKNDDGTLTYEADDTLNAEDYLATGSYDADLEFYAVEGMEQMGEINGYTIVKYYYAWSFAEDVINYTYGAVKQDTDGSILYTISYYNSDLSENDDQAMSVFENIL